MSSTNKVSPSIVFTRFQLFTDNPKSSAPKTVRRQSMSVDEGSANRSFVTRNPYEALQTVVEARSDGSVPSSPPTSGSRSAAQHGRRDGSGGTAMTSPPRGLVSDASPVTPQHVSGDDYLRTQLLTLVLGCQWRLPAHASHFRQSRLIVVSVLFTSCPCPHLCRHSPTGVYPTSKHQQHVLSTYSARSGHGR